MSPVSGGIVAQPIVSPPSFNSAAVEFGRPAKRPPPPLLSPHSSSLSSSATTVNVHARYGTLLSCFLVQELRECVLRGTYRVPFYMSHECEMLLRKMLVLNPSKRYSLTEIMKDKWLNTTFEESILHPHKEELPDYSDPERIQFMMQLGFSRTDIHDSLTKQLFNNITATYILLGHRRAKTGSLGLPPGAQSLRSLSTDSTTTAGYLAG
ncbi:unnamed protein product, partial [Dibothriocephalus latus]